MQKEISLILKKSKIWIKKNNALDIILFGSLVRGKIKPNDIDLCIIIHDKDEDKSIDLVESLHDELKNIKAKIQINIITENSFLSGNTLTKTLLIEGYSIKKEKSFSSNFGFESKSLFVYSLADFTPSKRVRFHYLLKGRYGLKGILNETEGEFLGQGVINIPSTKEDILKEVFDTWKIKYKIMRTLIG